MPLTYRRKLAEYLKQDCVATMRMLDGLSAYAEAHDLDLTSTIGASAWRTASRTSGIGDADMWGAFNGGKGNKSRKLYNFARDGYYGGRTQVFRSEATFGYRYDINSAYPAALSQLSLPTGPMKHVHHGAARRAFESGKPGIFAAAVKVYTDTFIPPLPMRTKDRIAYPVGNFDGTWSGLELRYAQMTGTARVGDIFEALVWPDEAPMLKDHCDRVWALRAEEKHKAKQCEYQGNHNQAKMHEALAAWLKWYSNAPTGKLAQSPLRERVYVNPPDGFKLCDGKANCMGGLACRAIRACCIHKCNGYCGRPHPIDRLQRFWSREYWKIPSSGYVHWAAYLTAHARTELHRQATDDGQDGRTMVYCDTDSIYATEPRTQRVGGGLGEWKDEGTFCEFLAIAPKTYGFVDTETGQFFARAKGIPEAAKSFQKLLDREKVAIDRGVLSFRSAIRPNKNAVEGKIFQRKRMERGTHADGNRFGDRFIGDGKATFPVDAVALV